MNADFSVVRAVPIHLRFDKYFTYVVQSIVYDHYSLEKYDLPNVQV